MTGYEVVHRRRRWVPAQGRVLPHDWRLVPALLAGAAWVVSMAILARVPGDVAWVRKHLRASPGDNVVGIVLGYDLMGIGLALAVAHGLSVLAHGWRSGAPALVRWSRIATWLGVVGILVIARLAA